MSRTPSSKQPSGAAMATPSPSPSPPASSSEVKTLSSKVLGMKFMQRASEGKLREKLEKDQQRERAAVQWSTPTTAGASAAGGSTPLRPSALAFPSPFPTPSITFRPSVFAYDEDSSGPSLLSSLEAGLDAPLPSASSAASSAAPFIPGRRSYGAFNRTVEALIDEVTQARSESAQEQRAVRNSVSDAAMADHYVGMRGKGASRNAGASGASMADLKKQKKQKQKQQAGAPAQRPQQQQRGSKAAKRTQSSDSSEQPRKKQKKSMSGR